MTLSASTAHAACISATNPLDTNRYFSSVGRITAEAATGADDIVAAEDFSVHYDTYFKVVKTLCARTPPQRAPPPTSSVCGASAPTAYSNGTDLPSDAKHFSVPLTDVGVGQGTRDVPRDAGLRDAIKIIDPAPSTPLPAKARGGGFHRGRVQSLGRRGRVGGAIAAMPSIDAVFTDSWGTQTPVPIRTSFDLR